MKFQHVAILTRSPEKSALGEVVEAENFLDFVRKWYFIKDFKDQAEIQELADSFTEMNGADQRKFVCYGEELIEMIFVVP